MTTDVCQKCEGCEQVADTEEQEPWTAWLDIPLKSSMAVVMGLVRPIPCPECKGEPPESLND